eukprot:1512148-Rhodomonas_salina.1
MIAAKARRDRLVAGTARRDLADTARDLQSYDMWSVGVLFLELVLGTSKVFQRASVAGTNSARSTGTNAARSKVAGLVLSVCTAGGRPYARSTVPPPTRRLRYLPRTGASYCPSYLLRTPYGMSGISYASPTQLPVGKPRRCLRYLPRTDGTVFPISYACPATHCLVPSSLSPTQCSVLAAPYWSLLRGIWPT